MDFLEKIPDLVIIVNQYHTTNIFKDVDNNNINFTDIIFPCFMHINEVSKKETVFTFVSMNDFKKHTED